MGLFAVYFTARIGAKARRRFGFDILAVFFTIGALAAAGLSVACW